MVLKKSKFGGNTGNTLRKSGKGGYKTCRTAAFISKENKNTGQTFLQNDPPREEWMKTGVPSKKNENSLNTSSHTKFSLNKDKRWLLPEKLKSEIEVAQYREMLLTEKAPKRTPKKKCKQNVAGRAHVAVIDKVSDWGSTKSFGSNNMKSFINSVDMSHNRTSKSWMGPLDIPDDIQDGMDVTYTIETPIDSITWPYHTDRTDEFYINFRKQEKLTGKFGDFDDLDSYDDNMDDDIDDDWVDEVYIDVERYPQETLLSLEMFIKPKTKQKKKKVYRDSPQVDFQTPYEKGSYIVIDKPEDIAVSIEKNIEITSIVESVNEVEDEVPSTSSNMQQLNSKKTYKELERKVKNEDITSEHLLKRFGKQYVEGRCTPHRFIIFNENFNPDGIIMSVRILEEGSIFSTAHITFVNISNDFIPCLEVLFGEDILNFEFLVDSCFPRDIVIKISKSSRTWKNSLFQKTVIDTAFKPNADLIRINEVCRELFVQDFHGDHGDTFHTNCYQAECPICFSIEKLICMKDCPHYACNNCWRSYINTKVSNGHYSTILCPDTDCKQTVDVATIISFLDGNLVSRYIQKHCELHILKSSGVKFCPSRDCDAVAVFEASNLEQKSENILPMAKLRDTVIENNPCVDCHCKLSWCFNCQEPDHWPSSCLANKTYQLHKKKDFDLIFDRNGNLHETEILYRPCPKCRFPINKNGGCPHMSCVICGYQFCWNCLRGYIGHGTVCLNHGKDVIMTFSSLDMLACGPKESRMLAKALSFSSSERKAFALNHKLKLDKIYFKYANVDHRSNVLVSTASKAITLLASGYKLLENLSASNAVCRSRHRSARIMRFMKMFTFVLGLLNTSLDVNKLEKLKVANVRKNMEFVESSLNELSTIGVNINKL